MMTRKTLRYFQEDAINFARESLIRGESPYLAVFTGLGKSLIIADIIESALLREKRVLQLCPTQELVTQNYAEIFEYSTKKHDIGICCAQLSKNQVSRKCVVAMVNSFLSKRATSGSFDLLLIDECDLVSPEPESMYQKIIKSLLRINPNMAIVGLTASGYRHDQGVLEADCIKGKATFTECAYDTSIDPGIFKLIDEGYLSRIENVTDCEGINTDDMKLTSSGDYNRELLGVKFDVILPHAVANIKEKFKKLDIKTSIIYASTIANANKIKEEFGGDSIRVSHGGLSKTDRQRNLDWLKESHGERHLINVGLYIRGFNYPKLQSVVFLVSTAILSKYVQILGRLTRPHDDKDVGYILDFGNNVERHGCISDLTPPKTPKRKGEAPKRLCDIALDRDLIDSDGYLHKKGLPCNTLNILSAKKCKLCDSVFIIDNETGGYSMRSTAQILSDKEAAKIVTHEVGSIDFEITTSRDTNIKMIKMNFYNINGDFIIHSLFCLNHTGKAQQIAKSTLRKMFKDQKNYYQLGSVGVNVGNIYPLLSKKENYGNFFKKIIAVTIAPQRNNPKYNEVRKLTFEAE